MNAEEEYLSPRAVRATSTSNGRSAWLTVALCLFSSLITLAGAYFTIPRQIVTRPEVEQMIQTQGPYIEDRKAIQTRLDELSYQNGQIQTKLDLLLNQRYDKQNR